MRVLVTGIGGFAGGHLAQHLTAAGDEVLGVTRDGTCPASLRHLRPQPAVLGADLRDADAVRDAMVQSAPDIVYHLAALASAAVSVQEPVRVLCDNVATAAAVLHGCLAPARRPRVLLVTTSDMYGVGTGDAPLDETTPLAPPNAYAVSKVTAHHLGQQLWRSHGLEVIEARPFNHLGPRQRRGFVLPDFASQLVAIERGEQPPELLVGDLRNGRDFSDVRDVVRGYRAAAVQGQPGEVYHFCSGRRITVAELLDRLIAACELDVAVRVDPARLRPGPPSVIVGSAAKAAAAFGWRADITLEQTLAEVVSEWRTAAG